jgi:hypothetical protein
VLDSRETAVRLIRLALVTLESGLEELKGLTLKSTELSVGPLMRTARESTYLLPAEIGLKFAPKKTAQRLIVVPPKERRRAEEGIEHFANLLAVCLQCSRIVGSPSHQ